MKLLVSDTLNKWIITVTIDLNGKFLTITAFTLNLATFSALKDATQTIVVDA